MDFRKYLQAKSFGGALSALSLAAGLTLSGFASAQPPGGGGGDGDSASLSIDEPVHGDEIQLFTTGGLLPNSIPMVVELSSSGVMDVTVQLDSNEEVPAAEETDGEWTAFVDLVDATNAVSGTYAASLVAYGIAGDISGYDSSAVRTEHFVESNTVVLTVSILDIMEVTGPGGGTIPLESEILSSIAGAPGGVVTLAPDGIDGVVTTYALADTTNGADVYGEVGIAVNDNRVASIEVTASGDAIDDLEAPPGARIVVMTTYANNGADLLDATGTLPSDPADVVFKGLFVRVVVLIETPAGSENFEMYDGELSGFTINITINQATAITSAKIHEFTLQRDLGYGEFDSTSGAAYEELTPAATQTRVSTVTDGEVNQALGENGVVLGLEAEGGDAISGGGGGGGDDDDSTCFIATAAYGTPMAQEIYTLRAVRDTYMLNNAAGSIFVDTYYRLSPALADKVAESPMLAAVVRALLTPIVLLGKLILAAPMALVALTLAGAGLVLAHRRVRRQS